MKILKYAQFSFFFTALFIQNLLLFANAQTLELSGFSSVDYRFFPEPGIYTGQKQHYLSLALQPEIYREWSGGRQSLVFTGFARLAQYDKERSHWDIREFYWQFFIANWELSIGLKQLFWGVTESNHLVDVINQTDFVEGIDGEDKLGQPMVHLSYQSNWGTLDLFLMPYFRPRRFPSNTGRFWVPILVNPNDPLYESSAKNKRLDLAIRWAHTIQMFDIGISHFYGTNREQQFVLVNDNQISPKFRPLYEIIHQTGFDFQITFDDMLWKLETIRRQSNFQTIIAITAGFEYSFRNIQRTGTDIGFLGEYLFDDRGKRTPNGFNDDIFLGSRITLNDVQNSQILFGAIIDRKNNGQLFSIEGSRRIGDSWKAELEVRILNNTNEKEFIYLIRKDSFVQFRLLKYI
jgi:hypothetical protein